MGESGCWCLFFWPSPHVTSTPPWLLRLVRISTSSELYPDTRLFFECLGIQFLICSLVSYGMRCYARGHLHFLPREADDFPRGERYFKDMPLLTCLIYLSPKEIYWNILFKGSMKNGSYEI